MLNLILDLGSLVLWHLLDQRYLVRDNGELVEPKWVEHNRIKLVQVAWNQSGLVLVLGRKNYYVTKLSNFSHKSVLDKESLCKIRNQDSWVSSVASRPTLNDTFVAVFLQSRLGDPRALEPSEPLKGFLPNRERKATGQVSIKIQLYQDSYHTAATLAWLHRTYSISSSFLSHGLACGENHKTHNFNTKQIISSLLIASVQGKS